MSQSFLAGVSDSLVGFVIAWASSRYGAAALGGALIAGVLPGLVLSLAGGVLADRIEARKLLFLGMLLGALALLLAAFWYAAYPGAAVFAGLNLALATLGSLSGASVYVLLPALFPEKELVRTNAGLSLAGDAAHLVGPLLGAALFAGVGVEGTWLAAAVLSMVAGSMLIALPPAPRPAAEEPLDAGFVWAGFALLLRAQRIRRFVWLFAAVNLFAAAFQVATPFYAAALGGAGAYAILLSAMNLGMTASNLALSAVALRSSERLIFASSLVQGLALVGLGRSRALPAAAAFGALNDAMANVGGMVFVAFLQAKLPEALLGRAFAAVHALAMLLAPLGFAVAPWLVERLGAGSSIVMLGAGTMVAAALVWFDYVRGYRPGQSQAL